MATEPEYSSRHNIIGITVGDPAGIGPEVARAALASGLLDPDFEYRLVGGTIVVEPGCPTAESARFSLASLEEAARLTLRGEIAAVVTGPVYKAGLYDEGFRYAGQTEFFADRCGTTDFAMMLTGGGLTVALVSTHLPLRDAIEHLTSKEIVRVGKLLAAYLRLRLHRRVRVAVAGLNPHAGEGGALGREELDVIAPAIAEMNAGHDPEEAAFHGPISPDAVFNQALAGKWDGVLCMYHDQGLIPLKLHAFDEGVNVTLGLPIIRTSPDHGTAFDLAGKNVANPGSMIAALRLAAELVKARRVAEQKDGRGAEY